MMARSAALVVLLALSACARPAQEGVEAVYACALSHHGHTVSAGDDAMALFFEETVTHGLEHLAVAAGTSLDASVDEQHDALAPRLASEGIADDLVTAFVVAGRTSYSVPSVTLDNVTLVRIAEDDYRERLTATDCKAIASELGFDEVRNLGLWSVSPVGFNDARDQALVYTSTGQRGALCVLALDNGEWMLMNTVVLWTT